ncbi:hypothetical protein BKA69DRAFT_205483 [Paraphysoderma sedebokerense]|nr:hypothetical protein BKA69DRAFT_205483 [Paraphysoderma sedebokerense]
MNYMPSIIVISVFLIIFGSLYFVRQMKIYKLSFAFMNILVNFLQTVWMLRKVRLDWPPELLAIIDYLNFLNFNVELVSPECLIKSELNFSQKTRIVLAIPIVLAVFIIWSMAILMVVKGIMRLKGGGSQRVTPLKLPANPSVGSRTNFILRLMKLFNIALSILYVNLAAKSLSLFDCTLESDGKAYLDDDVSLVCYTDWWYRDLPINVAAVIVYAIGIPLYFGLLSFLYCQSRYRGPSWENWRHISRTIMQGDGDFKPQYQYFIVIQLLHKLAIVSISIFFSR